MMGIIIAFDLASAVQKGSLALRHSYHRGNAFLHYLDGWRLHIKSGINRQYFLSVDFA